MAAPYKASVVLATSNTAILPASLCNDLLVLVSNSNQSMLFGASNTATWLRINSNGFIGVGKSNPGYTLDILGNINFVGSLTSNGVPFVSGGAFSNNGSNVYVLAPSNIGIHVATPLAALHVASNARIDGDLVLSKNIQFGGVYVTPGGTATNAAQLILATSNIQGYSNLVWGASGSNGTQYSIMSNSSNDVFRWVAGAASNELMRLNGAGRLGVGTSAPAYTLDVGGDINFSGTLRQGGAAYVGSQWSNTGANVYLVGSNVGLGTSAPASILHLGSNGAANVIVTLCNAATGGRPATVGLSNSGDIVVACASNNNLLLVTSNSERMRVTSNGLVGIGTAAPGSTLTVVSSAGTTIPLNVTGVGVGGGGSPVAQFFNSNGAPVVLVGSHPNSNLYINYASNTNTAQVGVYGGTGTINITSNNVGLGTGTPAYNLEVACPLGGVGLGITNTGVGAFHAMMGAATTYSNCGVLKWTNAGTNNAGNQFQFGIWGINQITCAANGCTGIMNASPAYTLDVNGYTRTKTVAFLAYCYGGPTVSQSTGWSLVPINNTTYNYNASLNIPYNGGQPGAFGCPWTVTVAGIYDIKLKVYCGTGGWTCTNTAYSVNTNTGPQVVAYSGTGSGAGCWTRNLSVNDVVYAWYYQSGGSGYMNSWGDSTNTYFACTLLAAL